MRLSKRLRTVDCLGLGIVPLDILLTVPYYPRAGHKIDAENIIMQGGGPVPNSLVGLARLGVRTSFIGAVGDDFVGRINIEELKREKVDVSSMIVKRELSALASGMIETGSGRRTIALHRKIHVNPRDLDLASLPIPRLIHLDGRDLDACIKLARWGRKMGATISFDIGSIRNEVSPIFPLVDHLVVADAYALAFTRTRSARGAIEKLMSHCPGQIVVTEGIKGSLGYDGTDWYRQPAFKVKNVDTTGAGDSFHAGYLLGVLTGLPMPERLRIGAATAALKCTMPGARTGAPTLAQLQTFLRQKRAIYA